MKSRIACGVAAFVVAMSTGASSTQDAFPIRSSARGVTIDLAKAQIECANKDVESCRTAAAELEKHLALIAPGRMGGGEIVFVVGKAPAGASAPGRFESYVRAVDGKIYFWGDDTVYEKTTAKGTLFAVYEFLDKALGVKWVFPGDDGIVFSRKAALDLENGTTWSYRPSFDLLSIRIANPGIFYSKAAASGVLMPKEMTPTREEMEAEYRIQIQWLDRMRTIPTNKFSYCHAFCNWQEKYLKQHPDWFGLDPKCGRNDCGMRGLPDRIASRAKFCLSNPEVTDAIVANWRDNLGANRYFNICPNDGTPGFCHCENCCKLDTRRDGEAFLDHLTDRYLWFWNGICDRAVKIRPDVRCVTYIYGYYRHKPRRERVKYPDNMVFGMVPGFFDDYVALYRDWQEVGMKHFFLRPNYTCYSAVFPRGLEKWLYKNFKVSLEYGMIGVDYDGTPRPVMDFEYYVITSLASRPEKNFEDISREFYSQYGTAAEVARAYFEQVRERAERTGATMQARVLEDDRHMLDDSELSKYAFLGYTAGDLESDCAVLAKGNAMELEPAARKRFNGLVLRAENALLTIKFLAASRGTNDAVFMTAAKALYDFRLKNRHALGNEGFHWYSKRNCENSAWEKYNKLNGRSEPRP